MTLRWYVARTQPRAEFLAADELTRDGFQVFFPRVKAAQPRQGHADVPLFPGYLFLRCDPGVQGWPSFRPAHRIASWLRFGDEIPWLPDEVVTSLMECSASINHHGGLWRRYQAGETVQVVSGTINSLAVVLEEAKSPHARVNILLEFMGRMVRAQVPWVNLQPVEDQPPAQHHAPRRTRGRGRWTRQFRSAAAAAV
jgi:transcriptional antiterminator RfaH